MPFEASDGRAFGFFPYGCGMDPWEVVPPDFVPADVQQLVQALLEEADQAGCSCDPEVQVPELLPGEVGRALVIHERQCPLYGSARLPMPISGVSTHSEAGRPAQWN